MNAFFHYSQNEFLFFVFTSYKFVHLFVMNVRTPKADGQVVDFSKKKKKKKKTTHIYNPAKSRVSHQTGIEDSQKSSKKQTPWRRDVPKKKKKKKKREDVWVETSPQGSPGVGLHTHTQSSFNSSGLHLAPARTGKTSPERAGRAVRTRQAPFL